jgi:hypothetical protein
MSDRREMWDLLEVWRKELGEWVGGWWWLGGVEEVVGVLRVMTFWEEACACFGDG